MSVKDYAQQDPHDPHAQYRHGRMSKRQRNRRFKKEGKLTSDERFTEQWKLFGFVPEQDDGHR